MKRDSKRVFITGIGIVNPAGIGRARFWESVRTGRSAIGPITRFDAADYPVRVAGEIQEFSPADFIPRRYIVKTDRFTHYALAAAELALTDAALNLEQEDSYRVGVWFGNNAGGWDICERGFYELYRDGATLVNPWQATAWFPTAAQGYVTIRYGIRGYSKSFVCDRASGASGLIYGARSIQNGYNDVVLAGGSEAPLTRFGVSCYYETGEVSGEAYRPFDRGRDGHVLGEGATVLVLESEEHARRRGARLLGEVLAGRMSTDADGEGSDAFARAMAQAIAATNLTPADIDLVLAEGAATRRSDRAEAEAIGRVFGEAASRVPVSVPKALFGHLYGASAVTEAACALMAMDTGDLPAMPPVADPDCGLNFVTAPTAGRVRHALINSRAREGVNATIVVGDATDVR